MTVNLVNQTRLSTLAIKVDIDYDINYDRLDQWSWGGRAGRACDALAPTGVGHYGAGMESVLVEQQDSVLVVTLNRPWARNAVDGPTAAELHRRFVEFDSNPELSVAVLTGADGTFCSGADLKAIAAGSGNRVHAVPPDEILGSQGPMGPTRLVLSKPTVAAVEGYAVAGGFELALWCDLRVMAADARLGVFCRRWGVPLVDGGTVRLARLIGESRALDLVLTGREVEAREALAIGLANRVAEPGRALNRATGLARELAALPQHCLRSDRRSLLEQSGRPLAEALARETELGLETMATGETMQGAGRFASGVGRHGTSAD